MTRRLLPLLFVLLPGVMRAQRCPDGATSAGYPVSATAEGIRDGAWLAGTARAAAYRWQVPSRRRNAYAGWERVQRRLLPPEPRWADDWAPEARHRARVRLTLFGDARQPGLDVIEQSGDEWFDRSLASIVKRPMPAAPPFPPLPIGEDSVVVEMALGHEPPPHAGVVRFAASQTRIELVPNSLRLRPPDGRASRFPETTVKYDVREDGRVDPTSLEFVRSSGQAFEAAIRDALLAARFRPPTSNCRPVAQSVVQTFGR